MGRPSKRTPENAKTVLSVLKTGETRVMAYMAAGIGHSAFSEWIRADEDFLQKVEEAEQVGRRALFKRVSRATQPRKVKKTRTEYGPTPTDANGQPISGAKPIVLSRTVEEYDEIGDWRAALALLERLDRKHFGKNIDVTSNGQVIKAYAGFDVDEV